VTLHCGHRGEAFAKPWSSHSSGHGILTRPRQLSYRVEIFLRLTYRQSSGGPSLGMHAARYPPPGGLEGLVLTSELELLAQGSHVSATTAKVMVVDDSVTIRRTAESLLRREGFEVVTAEDGFEALSKIVEARPDIIFLDIMMPRLDGYQTCAVIKNNQEFGKTPVIMLSSKDGIFDRARGTLVGSAHYVTKPFTREELLEAIQDHLPLAS
jgi:twitching motility two-component system response regulator PilG